MTLRASWMATCISAKSERIFLLYKSNNIWRQNLTLRFFKILMPIFCTRFLFRMPYCKSTLFSQEIYLL